MSLSSEEIDSSSSTTTYHDSLVVFSIIASITLVILGSILVQLIPLPRPNFALLKKIFQTSFDKFREKRRSGNTDNTEDEEDKQCFICLCECEDEEFVYFTPCFHKVCQSCCISLFQFNQPSSAAIDHPDPDFDDVNLVMRGRGFHRNNDEGNGGNEFEKKKNGLYFTCPLCRRKVLAVVPKKALEKKICEEMDENKEEEEGEMFPQELRIMNHKLFHSVVVALRDGKPWPEFAEIDDGETKEIFKKGEHLGFGRKDAPLKLKYDWRSLINTFVQSGILICVFGSILFSFVEVFMLEDGSGLGDDEGNIDFQEF